MKLEIISSIKKFYINSKNDVVSNAAQGWSYASTVDKDFIQSNFSNNPGIIAPKEQVNNFRTQEAYSEPLREAWQIIEELNKEKNIADRYALLKNLIENEDLNIINDTYHHEGPIELGLVQKRIFKDNELNVAIIGAGIIGLFLALTLKNLLGLNVNILALDNRSNFQHTRRAFSREWLTHVEASILQKYTPENIRILLECFGTGGFAGLPINMLETLLMISCKEQGVHFYFSPELDYEQLNNKAVSFFIDATGGRLDGSVYSKAYPEKLDIKVPEKVNNSLGSVENFLKIKLEASGNFHFPHFSGSKIKTHMIKLTGIPISLLKEVSSFIEAKNAAKYFYIWKGVLVDEINTGLVFINLTKEEHDLLATRIEKVMALKTFLKNNKDIMGALNENIKLLLTLVNQSNCNTEIKINRPFGYTPYINLNAEQGQFNNKPIFPVGDAYFCGHPKVGNGLWTHLGFINHLVQIIEKQYKN